MKRIFIALTMITTTSAAIAWNHPQAGGPLPDPAPSTKHLVRPAWKERIREHPVFTAFEFDIFNKERMGTDPHAVYANTWKQAMKVCDDAGGYLTEYHDGYKRLFADTREGAARMYAYATCRVSPDAEELSLVTHPEAVVRQDASDLLVNNGRVTATGHLDKAYDAARQKVYDSCTAIHRRVRFMSFTYQTTWDRKDQVTIRFACNSGIDRSP